MPLIGIPAIMGARGGAPAGGYQYKRSLTIDHTQVPNTDQSNFPVLVSFTNATFKTVGNGGHVQNANGYDIVFFSDSGLTTMLDFQIEFYDAVNGIIVFWVRNASVSHTTDTVFYMGYGNAAITTSQENVAGTWNSLVGAVYHLANGTTLSVADGSGNANNGTNNSATATAGQIDGGAAFSGTSQYIACPTDADFDFGTGDFTLSCWFLVDSVAAGYQVLLGKDVDTSRQWVLAVNPVGGNNVGFISFLAVNTEVYSNVNSVSDDTWYLVHLIRDTAATGQELAIYLNGTVDETRDTDTGDYSGTNPVNLGRRAYPSFEQYLDGSLDEVRIIKGIARSADWIATEYNNQSSPTTFVTLGTET